MKLSAFEKIIRKVIREEINYALRREMAVLKEELGSSVKPIVKEKIEDTSLKEEFRSKIKAQMPPPNFNTGNGTLDSLLSETALAPTAEETFAVNDPVNQFLNKDYSQLMSAIDKKKEFRP